MNAAALPKKPPSSRDSELPLFLSSFLRNFVTEFADPKVSQPGGWMPYQQKLALSIMLSVLLRRMDLLTVLCARQMGKTEAVSLGISAAITLVNLLRFSPQPLHAELPDHATLEEWFPDGIQCGIYAPDEDTAGVDFKRIVRILRRVSAKYAWRAPVDNTQRYQLFARINGDDVQLCFIEIKSAAPASKVESRSWNVILVEEAQDISHDKLYNEIDPTGAASAATRIRVGTVGDQKCAFDEEIDFNKATQPQNHFEFDYTVGVRCGFRRGAYERYIEQEIAKHGSDSPFFKRKYRLLREYESGMLVSEEQFVLKLSRPRERRWSADPRELPAQLVVVAALDVARSQDSSVLKIGTADWRFVTDLESPKPELIERWSKTYDHADYDVQFAQMLADLKPFPRLRKEGVLVIDGTGDRGDMVNRFINAGYNVIPIIFTGGSRLTEFDEKTGELKPGSKSSLCIDFTEQITSGKFGYAALPAQSERPETAFMGTIDFLRAIGKQISDRDTIVPPDEEYKKHKHEATHCYKTWSGGATKALNLQADPKNRFEHDDHIDCDMLMTFGGLYFRPVNFSLVTAHGPSRTMTKGDSFRESFTSLQRVFS